jgi:hypothetical protein
MKPTSSTGIEFDAAAVRLFTATDPRPPFG